MPKEPLEKDVNQPTESQTIERKVSRGPLVLIAVLLAVGLIAVVGDIAVHMSNGRFARRNDSGVVISQESGSPHMRGGGMMVGYTNNNTSTDQTATSGVVTSVGSDSFVVGGGGQSVTVKTTGSTTWNTTDKKVSVNDTVSAIGTESGSTLTAATVRILNY